MLQSDEKRLTTRINLERSRYFAASRWSGPIGIAASVGFYALIISSTSTTPGPLRWWVAAMMCFVVLQIGAFLVHPAAKWLDSRGIPVLSDVAYTLVGVGWGSILWIDLDAARAVDVRWVTLAAMFAVSAGVVAGISGVNYLSGAVFLPMWFGTIGALVAIGHLSAAGACAAFVLICFRDLYQSGHLWTELMTLRVESHDAAEANLWAATHDSMTALVNRSGFMQVVRGRAEVSDSPITVMFVDLDRFKEVNDNLGHAAGDHVLIEAAIRIQQSVRSADLVGRFGGDEFCVLLAAGSHEHGADRLAHKIIEMLERPFEGPWGPEAVDISASIGVASIAPADATPERLMLDADFAMYEAKRLGRRRVVHFGSDLEAELSARLGLKADFRRLIREGKLEADGQPVFDLETGRVAGVELLARWRLPDGSSVPPTVFIPLAEELGLIGEVTSQMLRRAGEAMQAWRGHPELGAGRVSVNVSASNLGSGTLVSTVSDLMAEFEIGPDRLVLELTESIDFAGSATDLAQFEALSKLGVDIAIDDFGTGYSSLESLLSFPVQVVKLDASLIARLGDDPRQVAVLEKINELAVVLGQHVIVEGVETASQLEQLKQLGTSFAQGYYLCRPVPVHELADHLERLRNGAGSPLSVAFPVR